MVSESVDSGYGHHALWKGAVPGADLIESISLVGPAQLHSRIVNLAARSAHVIKLFIILFFSCKRLHRKLAFGAPSGAYLLVENEGAH